MFPCNSNGHPGAARGSQTVWTYDPTRQLLAETRTAGIATIAWVPLSGPQWQALSLNDWSAMLLDTDYPRVVYCTTYTYDPAGNRVLQNDSGQLTTYTYDDTNQLLTLQNPAGVTTYTSDADGNRTQQNAPSSVTYYSWDEDDRLIEAEPVAGVVAFTYNADGQRMVKTAPASTTRFIYDFQRLLEETDGSGATENQYTYVNNGFGDLVSEYDTSDTTYHAYDAQHSTDSLLDDSGSTIDVYKYKAFGLAQAQIGVSQTPFTYVGQQGYYQDAELELYYLGMGGGPPAGRAYDPSTGRFLTPDPTGFTAGDANLYRCVFNSPTNFTDPSGDFVFLIPIGIGIAIWLAQPSVGHTPGTDADIRRIPQIERAQQKENAVATAYVLTAPAGVAAGGGVATYIGGRAAVTFGTRVAVGASMNKLLADTALAPLVPEASIRQYPSHKWETVKDYGKYAAVLGAGEGIFAGASASVRGARAFRSEFLNRGSAASYDTAIPDILQQPSVRKFLNELPENSPASENALPLARPMGSILRPSDRGQSMHRQTGSGFFSGSSDEAYNAIRASTEDVDAIARNTGIKRANIQKVKDHLFTQEHLLDRYTELGIPAEFGRFDSDFAIANAWKRLETGTHTPADLRLLRHEAAESFLMRRWNDPSYNRAHNRAQQRFPAPNLEE